MKIYTALLIVLISLQTHAGELSTDWKVLISTKQCISTYTDKSGEMREGNALRSYAYQNFFNSTTKKEIIEFLISKLSSTAKTNLHICPYENATEGELAVYALENITKLKIFDYSGNNKLLTEEVILQKKIKAKEVQYEHRNHYQSVIRRILSDEEARNALSHYFQEQQHKSKRVDPTLEDAQSVVPED